MNAFLLNKTRQEIEKENYLVTPMQNFVFYDKYSREKDDGKKENWSECIHRYLGFFHDYLLKNKNYQIPESLYVELFEYIYKLKIVGSMRAKKTAGLALEQDAASGYNCSYLPIGCLNYENYTPRDSLNATYCFSEVLYLLMCGCGVGFSVEKKLTNTLPIAPNYIEFSEEVFVLQPTNWYQKINRWFFRRNRAYKVYAEQSVIEDTRIGWCEAFNKLILGCYSGVIPRFDFSQIRPYGAKLKTLGGYASGPEALAELFNRTTQIFLNARGRKLKPIECHDICCLAADSTMKGGVRRAALISLSDFDDQEMRDCKTLENLKNNPWRARANNSYVYDNNVTEADFWVEWSHLWQSGSGERGFFSRKAVRANCIKIGRAYSEFMGTNPCGEIALLPFQLCNLSEVILPNVFKTDSEECLLETKKAFRLAAILGTFQACLTDFRFLRKEWKETCESQRLLGVSMTGISDVPSSIEKYLEEFKQVVISTNEEFSKILGINKAAASTCIKPSGTVSQLVNCSSGIHECYSKYYLRSVNVGHTSPMYEFLKDQGMPMEPCLDAPDTISICYFPFNRESSITQSTLSGKQQIEQTLLFQEKYVNHSVSRTIFVKKDEWVPVGQMVFNNLEQLRCLAFFPFEDSDSIYPQPVYKRISFEDYEAKLKATPKIDWNKFSDYQRKIKENVEYNKSEICGLNGCDN